MNKITKNTIVFMSIIIVVSLMTVLVTTLASSYLTKQYADAHHGCMPGKINYHIIIHNNTVKPDHINGYDCETMTITNNDSVAREMAFGLHEEHVTYDGIIEEKLTKGQSVTVTFKQTGNFRFHDHDHDEVQGTFTVK